jgi:hypothetical protein
MILPAQQVQVFTECDCTDVAGTVTVASWKDFRRNCARVPTSDTHQHFRTTFRFPELLVFWNLSVVPD